MKQKRKEIRYDEREEKFGEDATTAFQQDLHNPASSEHPKSPAKLR